MKINVRPLKGEAFDVEAEPEDSVEVLKAKVAAIRPELPAGQLKLVFAGKVLQDGVTLQESSVKDGDFLVIMVTKPKAGAAGPAVAVASPVPPAPAPVPVPTAVPQSAEGVAASGMVGGQNLEATIQMMCDMGFPRSEVERCLRAAFGNPDRAVEYLMSGIPPHLMQQASGQSAPPAPAPAPVPMAAPVAGNQASVPAGGFPQMPMAPGGNATGPLAKVRNHPLFFRLKAAVQQNPAALNQVLSFINQADPSLIPLIAEHQEEFVEMLQEPMPTGLPGVPTGGPAHAPMGAAGGAAPVGSPVDPVQSMIAALQAAQQAGGAAPTPAVPAVAAGPAAVPAAAPQLPQLSAAEQEAVERLQTLGFDRAAALQAYLACERNEELAANYLFDMADDN